MTIDELRTMSKTELEALAFQAIKRLQNEQNNVNVLEQLIAEKSKTKAVEPEIVK